MTPTIELDSDIFEYLKSQAEPFVDTPSSVLRRLLHLGGTANRRALPAYDEQQQPEKRAMRSTKKGSAGRRVNGRTRAPSGTLLPEQQYEKPLLHALAAADGEAPYREILDAVGQDLRDILMPADFETLSSGSVRWHSRLQFVRLRLIERGEMDRDAPRGIWRITEAGRQALKAEQS